MRTFYADTSVFGGKFDEEFAFWTNKFFERVFQSGAILLYSDVIDDELTAAPEEVTRFVGSIPDSKLQSINLNEEAIALAERYIAENVGTIKHG